MNLASEKKMHFVVMGSTYQILYVILNHKVSYLYNLGTHLVLVHDQLSHVTRVPLSRSLSKNRSLSVSSHCIDDPFQPSTSSAIDKTTSRCMNRPQANITTYMFRIQLSILIESLLEHVWKLKIFLQLTLKS